MTRLWILAVVLLVMWSQRIVQAQDNVPATRVDVVLRHNGLAPLKGEISLIDASGILMRATGGTDASSTTVSWYVVRDVDSEKYDKDWTRYQETAEQLWRGVARIRRGDPALAEALFERLFEQYRGQTHETALVVAEGLLRCRLARAVNELAVIPWLEAARLREAGVTTDAFADLEPVVDSNTLICPQLAPAWPARSRIERLRDDLAKYDAHGSAVITALAGLYRQFTEIELGEAVTPNTLPLPKHAGVEILSEILALRTRTSDAPPLDIVRIERRAASWPAWANAWMHYHLGKALVAETSRDDQDLGLVQLANVPARFRYAQPYLAGLALVDMAAALEARGDTDHATALRRLVRERYPGHPALDGSKHERTVELKANS